MRLVGNEGGWIQRNLYWDLIPSFPILSASLKLVDQGWDLMNLTQVLIQKGTFEVIWDGLKSKSNKSFDTSVKHA